MEPMSRCFAGNFYPRPPYGGRRIKTAADYKAAEISIHVPRMGDDTLCRGQVWQGRPISIHVPRMGDDHTGWAEWGVEFNFYPRPPYGGRPFLNFLFGGHFLDFYPRPPYGGRHWQWVFYSLYYNFYPRPPYGGRR